MLFRSSLVEKNFKLIYIDTLKHEDSLISHLLVDSSWKTLSLSICDENYKSLAPDFMSDKDIMEEVANHRRQGLLDIFAMEYMGMPVAKETATFKSEDFKSYREDGGDFLKIKDRLINIEKIGRAHV